jgi:DNA primase
VAQRYIDFAYVKENASFERVIAGYNLKLLGTGAQRTLLCPFHRERKPSCKIDLERKIFHCFGCEAKGNVLEFAALLEGDKENLRAAAIKVAQLCGIATAPPREDAGGASRASEHRRKGGEPQKRRPDPVRAATRQPALPAAAKAVPGSATAGSLRKPEFDGEVPAAINPTLTFQLKLDPTHPYLRERGLSAEQVERFGLGYCSRGVMAGRVCVPIHNEQGGLVAYAGRWPGEDVPEGQEPRSRRRAPRARRGVLVGDPAARHGRAGRGDDGLLDSRRANRAVARSRNPFRHRPLGRGRRGS